MSIPIYLHIDAIRPGLLAAVLDLQSPMGIETRIVIRAPFNAPPGRYTARLSAATITVGTLRPVPGQEGMNYTYNRGRWGLIDQVIDEQIQAYSMRLAQQMGDISVDVPTVSAIEALIGDVVHQELVRRQSIAFWTPDLALAGFAVRDIAVQALPNALAIGLNAGEGVNIATLANFIPAERDFATAISGSCVERIITQTCANMGCTVADRPGLWNIDGKDIAITTLNVCFMDQAIRVRGDAVVRHAIPGNLAVGTQFRVDVGLRWEPDGTLTDDNMQMLQQIIRAKAVYPQRVVAFWVIVVIVTIIAFGTIGQIGSLIIVLLALSIRLIMSYIGGGLVTKSVDEACRSMMAWPPNLMQIGQVRARCCDPVIVDSSGVTIAGDFTYEEK